MGGASDAIGPARDFAKNHTDTNTKQNRIITMR